ncbi:hypothetical protein ACIA8G_01235 [Lentzea sp. NPDC051213]|uniref:hypothetical protein n=1 Tax=Lentzea sp. NPDC051213 TaxID=3364126 RepID=UPI003789C351
MLRWVRAVALGVATVLVAALVTVPLAAAAPATDLWAITSPDAAQLTSGSGVVDYQRLDRGRYEFTFNQDVSNCSYTATINGLPPGDSWSWLAFTASGHLGPFGVYVETKTTLSYDTLEDHGVVLHVQCAGNYAVVDNKGNLRRGSGVTGVKKVGYGQFEVTFDRDVSASSFVATIGDPGAGRVDYSGVVFTASHQNRNTVLVQTKGTSGRLTDYYSFHLQIARYPTWVVTDYVGAVVRSSRVVRTERVGRGDYRVTFNHAVSGCAAIATIGSPDDKAVAEPGVVATALWDQATISVRTTTTSRQEPYDRPFHLQMTC